MEIPYGYCHCGCGQKTNISKRNSTRGGHKKGEPFKFLHHHHGRKPWEPDLSHHGYKIISMPHHPRKNKADHLMEHVLIAEKALGKFLSPGVEVHHFPSKDIFTHLVICQDHAYHFLLHVRHRAFIACGNPNWRKCQYCKKYDDIKNLYCSPNGYVYEHRACFRAYQREQRRKKSELSLSALNLITEDSQ